MGGFAQKMLNFFTFLKKNFLGGNGGFFAKRRNLARSPSSIPAPSFIPAPLPFPRKRESRGAALSATHRRRRHCTSASRNFPLTREEIPAFAGMEDGEGMEVFFYPPPLAGGGASAIAVAGGGVFPMMFGTSPPPKNSPCEFLPPPRKRRRVRFRLSPEWKCGYWGGAGNACTAPLITCRGKPLPAFFATPESHALPLLCRCRRRQFSASPSGRCICRSRSN